jgi:predicted nuclease of predicted toxin-antitoxin system
MTFAISALRLLADENIELQVVELLRTFGHDVMWLAMAAPGKDDADIPSFADREGRILLTYDVDFISAMRLSGRSHVGAILVRSHHSDFTWIAAAIHETLQARKSWQSRIAVIKPTGVRFAPND